MLPVTLPVLVVVSEEPPLRARPLVWSFVPRVRLLPLLTVRPLVVNDPAPRVMVPVAPALLPMTRELRVRIESARLSTPWPL